MKKNKKRIKPFYLDNQIYVNNILEDKEAQNSFNQLLKSFDKKSKYLYFHLLAYVFFGLLILAVIVLTIITIYISQQKNAEIDLEQFNAKSYNFWIMILAIVGSVWGVFFLVFNSYIFGFQYYLKLMYYKKFYRKKTENSYYKNKAIAQFIAIFSSGGVTVAGAVKYVGEAKQGKVPSSYIKKASIYLKKAEKINL